MAIKSILMSPMMVEAILAGRKTQTRRITTNIQPGDLVYVKEVHFLYGKWYPHSQTNNRAAKWRFVETSKDGEVRFNNNPPDDYGISCPRNGYFAGIEKWYKRNSLFMAQADARIWLQCTDVRKERVQDITEADAQAEGVLKEGDGYKSYSPKDDFGFLTAYYSFRSLWMAINGEQSWKSNPVVSVISFTVLSTTGKPVDLPQL